MIIRIVKMSFNTEKVHAFLEKFEQHKNDIRNFEGCEYLELLHQIDNPNVYFTHSKWQSDAHLQAYRNSELFAKVWAFTKTGFNDKPQAWSLSTLKALT